MRKIIFSHSKSKSKSLRDFLIVRLESKQCEVKSQEQIINFQLSRKVSINFLIRQSQRDLIWNFFDGNFCRQSAVFRVQLSKNRNKIHLT